MFANKTDVNGCMNEAEIQEVHHGLSSKPSTSANRMQGLQLKDIKTHQWHILRCSAIEGTNLDVGLDWVVEDAKARMFLY